MNAVFGIGLLVGSVVVTRAGGRLSTFRTTILLTVASGLGGIVYVASSRLPSCSSARSCGLFPSAWFCI